MNKLMIFVCCVWSFAAFGQIRKIQWASSLEYQYNQYEEYDYSGLQAMGPPNAFPPGHISKNAFRLSGDSEFGTIKLGFASPKPARQIIIVENNRPGRIVQVKLIDEQGLSYIIYQQEPQKVTDKFRTAVLSVPKTEYNVKFVEINLNSIPVPGFCQIDAVGILEDGNLADVRNILSGANYNVQQVMTFTAKKENLHDRINTRFTEAKPLVSHDGNTLYFSRLFYPENTGGKTDPQDIYVSKLINGQWTAAENIGLPLNDQFANGVCSIAPDGNKLLVINGYHSDGSISPGVSISSRTAIGWGDPVKVNITGFENFSQFQDFFLSADERVIIMAVERHDGYGDQDLYASLKTGHNKYSRPINLGLAINSTRADFAPFLSPDNTTLYFASDGHGGYGQSDIFQTKRLDETWKNWSDPQNLGPAVNSASWDAYFSITASGNFAYFVSSEGNRNGQENIYRIPLQQDIHPELPEPLVAFQGRTFDANTHAPVSAHVVLENIERNVPYRATSDDLSGNFLFYIPKDSLYEFTVKAPGYMTFYEQVSMEPFNDGEKIYRNIYLNPVKDDQIFTLNDLMFERSKPVLLEDSYPALEKLVGILLENPHMRIELAGHTDGLGSQKAKQNLSFQRVEQIKKYLTEFGIDRRRVEIVGYGGSRPIAPNNNEENRAKNRRVEIRILEVGS
ncbi:MAG: OmpA family protein [Cytophagales bacterium]|nr:OmpA family protein [Cytophagales bacterium]